MVNVRELLQSLGRTNIDFIDFYDNEHVRITTIKADNTMSESKFYQYDILTIEFDCISSTRMIITLDVKREDLKGW